MSSRSPSLFLIRLYTFKAPPYRSPGLIHTGKPFSVDERLERENIDVTKSGNRDVEERKTRQDTPEPDSGRAEMSAGAGGRQGERRGGGGGGGRQMGIWSSEFCQKPRKGGGGIQEIKGYFN